MLKYSWPFPCCSGVFVEVKNMGICELKAEAEADAEAEQEPGVRAIYAFVPLPVLEHGLFPSHFHLHNP